jgi:hypothetical protein
MLKTYLLFFIISIFSHISYAADSKETQSTFKQSFLSCAIITSEHLTVLQLYQRGLPRDHAIESLPNITRAAKKRVKYVYDLAKKIGVLNAYSDINTNFARCSTMVYQIHGSPAADLKEHDYYYCSGENKIRFEIILMINQNKPINALIASFPNTYKPTIMQLLQVIDAKGSLAAFDLTANNLKACLNQIN